MLIVKLSSFLSGDELLRMEKLTICACANLIHDRRLQIHLQFQERLCCEHVTVVARARSKTVANVMPK